MCTCMCTDFLWHNSNYKRHNKWPLYPADLRSEQRSFFRSDVIAISQLLRHVILWQSMNMQYGYVYVWPSTNSMHTYDSMYCALHSSEVPVMLYSVSIKAERKVVHWLFNTKGEFNQILLVKNLAQKCLEHWYATSVLMRERTLCQPEGSDT